MRFKTDLITANYYKFIYYYDLHFGHLYFDYILHTTQIFIYIKFYKFFIDKIYISNIF